eukprot:356534-Chlamydomonas_euryale.AAC.16
MCTREGNRGGSRRGNAGRGGGMVTRSEVGERLPCTREGGGAVVVRDAAWGRTWGKFARSLPCAVTFPAFSGRDATSMAAMTAAPLLMPQKRPSSTARRFAIATESSDETCARGTAAAR